MSDYMLCGHEIGDAALGDCHCRDCVDATIQERHEAVFKERIEMIKMALRIQKRSPEQFETRMKEKLEEQEKVLAQHQEACKKHWDEKQQRDAEARLRPDGRRPRENQREL